MVDLFDISDDRRCARNGRLNRCTSRHLEDRIYFLRMPTASEIREHLAELPYNSMYLQLLEAQCQKEGGIVPFVGAGFSAVFGYPQWGPFLLGTTPNPAIKVAIQEKTRYIRL